MSTSESITTYTALGALAGIVILILERLLQFTFHASSIAPLTNYFSQLVFEGLIWGALAGLAARAIRKPWQLSLAFGIAMFGYYLILFLDMDFHSEIVPQWVHCYVTIAMLYGVAGTALGYIASRFLPSWAIAVGLYLFRKPSSSKKKTVRRS